VRSDDWIASPFSWFHSGGRPTLADTSQARVLRVADLASLTTTGDYLAGFNDAVGSGTTTPTNVATRVLTRLALFPVTRRRSRVNAGSSACGSSLIPLVAESRKPAPLLVGGRRAPIWSWWVSA
jgi:hypothetical protein